MHFHYGKNYASDKENGAEHTLDGVHYNMEMHIVSMNQNPENKHLLLAAVTGIIFEGNATERSFADDFFIKLFNKSGDINLSRDFTNHLNTR